MLIVLIGCGDDAPSEFYFNINIDGQDYSSETAFVSVNSASTNEYHISGVGLNENGLLVTMGMLGPAQEGTFSTADLELVVVVSDAGELWGATSIDGSGTVQVIDNSTEFIEGTFSFEVVHTTNGSIRRAMDGSFKAEKL